MGTNDLEEFAAHIFRLEECVPSALKIDTSGSFEILLHTYPTKKVSTHKAIILVLYAETTLDLACISLVSGQSVLTFLAELGT
jgi:hypothetical protein